MSASTMIRRWAGSAVTFALAGAVCLAMLVPDADARRLGGGKSFGRQSSTVTQQQSSPPSRNAATQPAPQQAQPGQPPLQQPRNRWLGPLAGLAAGLGIAALLSHFGMMGPFAETLGSFIMIALLVVGGLLVWRMLRGARGAPSQYQPQTEPAYGVPDDNVQRLGSVSDSAARPGSVAAVMSSGGTTGSGASSAAPAAPWGIPSGFDVPGFTRSAKVNFIRLQTAWDAKNLADIREFTTPEVYAEIKMQMDEEKGTSHHTEVVTLDAELLGIEEGATDYLANVRFSGAIREDDSNAEPFQEVWNLAKPKDGRTGWLLAGIQQIH